MGVIYFLARPGLPLEHRFSGRPGRSATAARSASVRSRSSAEGSPSAEAGCSGSGQSASSTGGARRVAARWMFKMMPASQAPNRSGSRSRSRAANACRNASCTMSSTSPGCAHNRAARARPASRRGHVDKAAIMALERHGYGHRRAVPVLGHDQVRLTGPRRLPLIHVFTVQKDHNV
jgi:hypothetical protein